MKAWALLNLRTAHRDAGFYYTPFKDWHNHESQLLSDYGITGTHEEQMANLLARYENYASGKNNTISAERFAEIEAQVRDAARDWYKYGRNSDEDPVNGATGFWDAKGMRYPDGKETDPHLQEVPNYESNILTNYPEMVRFREVFSDDLVVSEVYQYDIWPKTKQKMYTFTVFHCPCK